MHDNYPLLRKVTEIQQSITCNCITSNHCASQCTGVFNWGFYAFIIKVAKPYNRGESKSKQSKFERYLDFSSSKWVLCQNMEVINKTNIKQ